MGRQRSGVLIGVFDLFHVGHLELMEHARAACDRLVVGVLADEWAEREWGERPFVPVTERFAIVDELRCVDESLILPAPALAVEAGAEPIVFAATGIDGVLDADELTGFPAGWISTLPPVRGSRSQILRAAVDRRPSRSSVA